MAGTIGAAARDSGPVINEDCADISAQPDSDSSVAALPQSARMGKGALTMAWWGVCSALFYIFLAATLALVYGTRDTLIGIGLSVIAYGLINGAISRYAIRTGQSVSLLSQVLFGRSGAVLATLIFFATAIYYAVFEGSVIAVAASKVIAGLSYETACMLVVLYSVPLVLGSVQSWLDKLNGVLLPFFLAGLALAVVLAARRYGFDSSWLDYRPAGAPSRFGWASVFVAYMGVWVLMMFTMDYARFGRTADSNYHARFNFGMPFYLVTFLLNGAIGVYLVVASKLGEVSELAVVDTLITVLGGWLGLVFIWVTQTRINSANYYLATVNMQACSSQAFGVVGRKWIWAIAVGLIALVLMRSTNVFGYILTAMKWQGVFVTAWVGVALSHILLSRRQTAPMQELQPQSAHRLNPRGLGAWFGGALVGIAMMLAGAVAAAWSPPATFIVSAVLYALLPAHATTAASQFNASEDR